VAGIEAAAATMAALPDAELTERSRALGSRLRAGESLEAMLPEAFAVASEAVYRVASFRLQHGHHLAAAAMHLGYVAELADGAHRPYTMVLAAHLNALAGHGVHVMTYHSRRASDDGARARPIFDLLGVTSALIDSGRSPAERRAAYRADVTYADLHEVASDYLRDHLRRHEVGVVQRGLNLALLDQADWLLLDCARELVWIRDPKTDADDDRCRLAAGVAAGLRRDRDYSLDLMRRITLTPTGSARIAERFGCREPLPHATLADVVAAVRAREYYPRGKAYELIDGAVVGTMDPSAPLRGLRIHLPSEIRRALQAREGLPLEDARTIAARTSYRDLLTTYNRLAGMTSTAGPSRMELLEVYGIDVLEVPDDAPGRIDHPDVVCISAHGQWKALAADVARRQQAGQPVLVGVFASDLADVRRALDAHAVRYEVAEPSEADVEPWLRLDQPGRVMLTCLTGQLARWTDSAPTGLAVVGPRTGLPRLNERLAALAGRDGEPGESQFYRLIRGKGINRIPVLRDLTLVETECGPWLRTRLQRTLTAVYAKVNAEHRLVNDYDEVVRRHQHEQYTLRRAALTEPERVGVELIRGAVADALERHWPHRADLLLRDLAHRYPTTVPLADVDAAWNDRAGVYEMLTRDLDRALDGRRVELGPTIFTELIRRVVLAVVDREWRGHLESMQMAYEPVHTQGHTPAGLAEYRRATASLHTALLTSVRAMVLEYAFGVAVTDGVS
jgi:preprotein translocase subunit SecA